MKLAGLTAGYPIKFLRKACTRIWLWLTKQNDTLLKGYWDSYYRWPDWRTGLRLSSQEPCQNHTSPLNKHWHFGKHQCYFCTGNLPSVVPNPNTEETFCVTHRWNREVLPLFSFLLLSLCVIMIWSSCPCVIFKEVGVKISLGSTFFFFHEIICLEMFNEGQFITTKLEQPKFHHLNYG